MLCQARSKKLHFCIAFAFVAFFGCAQDRPTLPETVELDLPDGTTVTVEQGAGVASLANSAWEFQTPNGRAFVTIRFGSNGELLRFEDNTLASNILGPTLIFDGEPHDTGIPPVQYSAATFGAETSDSSGFAFDGRLSASVPIIGDVGSGNAVASGTFSPDDPDIMTGDFSFSFEVSATLPIPLPVSADDLNGDFEFTAHRIE